MHLTHIEQIYEKYMYWNTLTSKESLKNVIYNACTLFLSASETIHSVCVCVCVCVCVSMHVCYWDKKGSYFCYYTLMPLNSSPYYYT